MERNLREDLEICYAATEGPWNADRVEWSGNENLQYWVMTHEDGVACAVSYEDARFIAEARDGWPHAIRRAVDAERKVAQMERRLRAVESTVERMLDFYECQDFWGFVMEYETEEVTTNAKA
ncbi:hypothetical protein O0555_15495 [Brevibacillus laterosporus]|uniref:hypothetical protein n=1 Tax=Brevibacillus laterosporus TaxID=1465 RepID=UPI00215CC119|nr:hypothetical protein [Brevibacillus laterosporus]MCR8938737.1 hypothetical protein [Brevibacillus laterosporus]MCR8997944.1 hypothetical protein [Brevibacillus laterosporus]MCZ0841377.1 hypothetical protein [Brevibacillus laterosporus]MCZ0847756.1 hypothetical protein [Brevibacillus laterosporus]